MSAQFLVSLIVIAVGANLILLACAYLILLERKVAAWTQDRVGPNRTNFSFGILPFKGRHFGLGQALADGAKLFFKEDYTPPHVDKALFLLAPMLAVITALIGWAVIPWGGAWAFPGVELPIVGKIEPANVIIAVAPINVALVYILAIGSLAVYGVVLGAYASNNKYSFLGGVRATAQMVSYEIPMGMSVLIMILTFGTMSAFGMAAGQSGWGQEGIWGIFAHPLLAFIFFTCVLAECNRAPFDLAESEQDLVGGFHTEYSSMKWALFFLGEYMHMITGSAFFCVLFLGGWDLIPFVGELPAWSDSTLAGFLLVLAKVGVFVLKVLLCLFVMMWVRWTLPRFRFDQLMRLAWRGLIPITLLILIATGFIVYLDFDQWWQTVLAMGIANIVIGVACAFIGPMLPQGPPVNRRIKLAGSRFSPLETA